MHTEVHMNLVTRHAVADARQGVPSFAQHAERLFAQPPTGSSIVEVNRHDRVYTGGGRDGHIYYMVHGHIMSQVVSATGKRCLLSIHAPGDVFGETSAFLGIDRPESAVALSRAVLYRLPSHRFRGILMANGLYEAFLRYMSLRILDHQRVIADMVTMPCEMRLAVRLLDLAARFGKSGVEWVPIEVDITQEHLAEMVGTTRSRVGHFIKRFRGAGLVDLTQRSRIVVHYLKLANWIEHETR